MLKEWVFTTRATCILSVFFEDAEGINKHKDIHLSLFQGLIRANEEFVAEVILFKCFFSFYKYFTLTFQVERLYVEEERWEGEGERLREEADQLREQLSREVEAAQQEVSYLLWTFF